MNDLIDKVFVKFPEFDLGDYELIKIRLKHAGDLFDYLSKEKVVKYYDIDVLNSLEDAKKLIAFFIKRYDEKRGIRWAIFDKSKKIIIGTIGYNYFSRVSNKAEMGYELSPLYWGKGIIPLACKTIINYAFISLKLNRIEALVEDGNKNSDKVLEKCGFQKEGLLKQYMFYKNKYVDLNMYAFLKDEWENFLKK